MKKQLSILTNLICGFIVLITIVLITSCGDNKKEENGQKITYIENKEEIDANLRLPYDNVNMIIGDELFINPNYEKLNGFELSYASSNNNATVNELGIIKAIKPGDSKIDVKYSNGNNEFIKSLNVNVSFGDFVPTINMSSYDNLNLEIDDIYNLNPSILFRNKIYDDAKFVIESLDDDVATVNKDGKITAISKGKARIIINATWRGKNFSSFPSLSTYIDLEVKDKIRFYNGNMVMSDISLYTTSNVDGNVYETTYNHDFKIKINDKIVNADYEIIDDSLIDTNNEAFIAKKPGNTTIRLYKEINGYTYTSNYKFDVYRPKVKIDNIVPMFSIDDGLYYDINTKTKKDLKSFINENDDIIEAYQNNNNLLVDDNKIYGIMSSSSTKRGKADIRICTQKLEYLIQLETITKIISDKEDLKYFEIKDKDIVGYYELSNNIDASGIKINQNNNKYYFNGIFNGCGYSISNLDISNSSMFGSLYSSSRLENFALKNLRADNTCYFASKNCDDSIFVKNVYIELSENTINPQGMFVSSKANNNINNVVIVYLGENANKIPDYSLGGWFNQSLLTSNQYYVFDDTLHTQTNKWNNVICISPYALGFRAYEPVLKLDGDNTNYAAYYFGINEIKDFYQNDISNMSNEREIEKDNCVSKTYFDIVYNEVYHFKNENELKEYSYDFKDFDNKYWIIDNGTINWRN